MTDWDNLSPRERDALVAEEVMGLSACPHYEQVNFGAAGGPMLQLDKEACDCEGETYPEDTVGSMHGTIGGCPNFTTDISAAWRVIEEMEHVPTITEKKEGVWFCKFSTSYIFADVKQYSIFADVKQYSAEADSVPEAICLAALRARGVDI